MTVVQTNDIERYLHEKGPGGLIVDVSDFDTSEVFGFTKALLQEDGTYRFESRDSWLIKKLERGEKVVLKGHFSERLIQGIAQHILLNPELGQHLALIGDLGSHVKRFSSIEPIIFDAPRKLTEEQEQSLSLLTHPELKLSVKDQSAEEFTRERIISIQTALQSNPFVFITGLSGCGKTTFIKKHLKPYLEKQGIEEWLKSDSVPCYLFFDEANLSHDNGLMFEGLLQKPPFIIFEGQYRDVPITHRVIFAGNPVTYGDERKIPKLLSQHPHVIVFDPIPPRALKEDILLPLFENTPLQGQANEISDVIIELYAVILSYSTNGVLISPRELQSIAMLTIANADHKDPVSLAKHYAFTIGRQIVPAKHVQAFEDAFKVDRPLPPPNTTKEFLITPSRAQTAQYLRDLLQLRTYRRTQENQLSNAQKTVGLGGFILEGEPGIGKSELLIEVLHHEFGLCKASSESHLHQDDVFYILPPSISLDERKALLLKAFHEGAVVIVDEMNSGPMLESFLNALLMGATPDGVPAARPGFTVLATQNPSSRGGRREQSEALLRRMLKFNLENYSKPEIQNILLAKGIEKPLASVLAGIFEERLRFAKEQGKKPEPSFRDLMRLVDNLKEHKVTLSIENVQSLNHHLKKLIELGFSSDEINQLIDTLPANAASEISEPEQLLSFLRGLLSSEMKSTVLKWCVEHKKLSPFLVEEILNIPALSVLLPLSITSTITEWSKSDVVLETLTFKTFILSDLAQLNKLTHISDENFQACCQHYTDQYFENDHGLEEFMGFCNSPIRAKMLAQVISDPKEFHAILSMFNHKQVEETIITSFIQNLGTKLFYFEQILEDLTLIESLPPEQALACLDLSYKPSLHNFSTLLSRINKQHLEYFLNWYIDKKHEINNHIFTEILQHPKLLQKIQNMSPGDFNSWIPINQDNRDLPFNAFILRLTILRGLNKSDKDVVDWINAIKLDDLSLDRVQLSKLFSKEFETTFSPIMKSTIFNKLFKSQRERINGQLTDLKEDEDVYKLMLDSSALLQSRFGMLINHNTDHPHQKHLINKLRTSIIEEYMKAEILERAPQWRLSLLEELCREPSSREYLFKSKNYLKEMRKIHQKMESVKDDEDANQPHLLHLQKLNDTQGFLMDILNHAKDPQKSNSDQFINEITEKTAQLVNKHQDPRIYHYVLNFMLLIFPPLLIFNLARKFLYNENVFYNEDNALTRAAKTMSDEIMKPSGRKT